MKIKGIKKAVGDYRRIIDRGNVARIMMDTQTGEVWTDEFVSVNSWIEYSDPNVVWLEYPHRVTMEVVRSAAERAIDAEF